MSKCSPPNGAPVAVQLSGPMLQLARQPGRSANVQSRPPLLQQDRSSNGPLPPRCPTAIFPSSTNLPPRSSALDAQEALFAHPPAAAPRPLRGRYRCARQRPGRTRSAARAPPGGGNASDRRTRARSSPSSGFPVMTRPSTRCWRTTPRRPTGRVPRCGPDRCRRSGPVPAARVALGRLVHVDVGAWHHVPVAVRGAVPPAAEERGVAPPRARCPSGLPIRLFSRSKR